MYIRNSSKNPQFLPSRPSPLSSTNDSNTFKSNINSNTNTNNTNNNNINNNNNNNHNNTNNNNTINNNNNINNNTNDNDNENNSNNNNNNYDPNDNMVNESYHHTSVSLVSSTISTESQSSYTSVDSQGTIEKSRPYAEPSSIISHESRQRYIRQQEMEREIQKSKEGINNNEYNEVDEQFDDDDDDNDDNNEDDDNNDDDDESDQSVPTSPNMSGIASTSPSPLPSPAMHRTSSITSTRSIESSPSLHYTKSVPPEFFNKLRSFPLFKHAPKSFHTRIVSKLKLIQYHAQEYIIKKGDSSKSMYWILKGNVAVTSTDGESIYAELIPGSFFGEIGILFNRPRTATVVAKTKVLLGVLTSESLNMVLPEYPVIERRIRDEAQERLAILEKKSRANKPFGMPNIEPIGNLGSIHVLPSNVLPPVFFHNQNHSYFQSASSGNSSRSSSPGVGPRDLSEISPRLRHSSFNDTSSGSGLLMGSGIVASVLSASIPSPSVPPIDRVRSPVNDEPKNTDNVDFTISIQEFIKSLPIFQTLPSDIIHHLALGVEPLACRPFEYIFRKGEIGSDIYFIIYGEVEVIDDHNSNSNYEKCLARLGYGSYFGEMSFLMQLSDCGTDMKKPQARRSANIRTVSNCELLVVRHDKLEEICKTYPFIIEDMRKTAGERNALNNSTKDSHRLSINYLMNDIDIPNSPILSIELTHKVPPILRKRGAIEQSDETDNNTSGGGGDDLLPAIPAHKNLNLSLPPLNPSITLINKFRPHESHHNHIFRYLPQKKRLRLASIGGIEKPSKLRDSSIPDSLLLKVMEYLTLPELMKLRGVCKKWRQLLYFAPNLFQTLDLTKWNTSIDDKSLISITDFVGSRPRLIDISNCFHVTDESFSYMINEIGISGQIKTLRMRSIWEVSAMAIMDLSAPSVGKYLEELDLSNCRKVRDNVLERLFGWNEKVISEFPIRHGHEADDSGHDLTIGCKSLKKLNVGYCKHLTDDIMYHISVHVNQNLEILNLTRCTTITDKGFNYWSYTQFPKLKDLSLKDCTFLTDLSIQSIANSAKNLEHLNLNFCCALSDTAIEVLCMGCPMLKTLDLSFCGSAVSDSSLVRISLNLNHLERLTIKGCVRVTRAGIDSILSGCSSLYFLDVSQCKNAHIYPGRIPAQKLNVNAHTKSAFVTAGPYQNIIEIVI